MSGNHPERLRDWHASKTFAAMVDLGPCKLVPTRRPRADQKSVEEALASLKEKTGFTPPTEADQKPLEPVTIFHEKSSATPSTEQSPEIPATPPAKKTDPLELVHEKLRNKPTSKTWLPKINPPHAHDPQAPIAIITDADKRRRALGTDGKQEANERIRRLRVKARLPVESQFTQKELLQPLTQKEQALLTQYGIDFKNTPKGTWGWEHLLLKLEELKLRELQKNK